MTITMFDSVDVNQIPSQAQAVAGYVGGNWPTFKELGQRFPRAHKLSIAVNSSEDAEVLDIENGDASVNQAAIWFHRQSKNVRPCFYTSLSNINSLVSTLEAAGIHRDQYRLWSAHYTGSAHICGPSEGIHTHAEATQYWDKALGRNLDVSLCEDSFFAAKPPVPSAYVPPDEARWEHEWDALKGKRGPWPFLRRRVLSRTMVHRERAIVEAAYKSGWGQLNRHRRYQLLFERTGKR